MEERIRSLSVVLTLACLVAPASVVVGSSLCFKSQAGEIKPSYQVIDSEGNVDKYTPESNDNFFRMDCTRCFPEGKLISMKIRDMTENCRNYGDTTHSKNKSVATINCRPCDNYDLEVTAKMVIGGVSECVNWIVKYRKDACPLNATVNTIVAQRHINTDIPIDVPVSNNSNNKAQSNGFKFYLSASMVALLLTNLHISYMLSVLN